MVDVSDEEEVDTHESCWHPSYALHQKWSSLTGSLAESLSTRRDHLFIYDFGPGDRLAFANAVMRYVAVGAREGLIYAGQSLV